MHYFYHDYTRIRSVLKLESLRSTIMKIDHLIAFKIAKNLYKSEEVNVLFRRRIIPRNLRNFKEIEDKLVRTNIIGKSATFRLHDLWNRLPLEIRKMVKLSIFKNAISEVIKEKSCERRTTMT